MNLYLKQLQIWGITLLLITMFTLPTFGDAPPKTIQFKNITIDTIGNQTYDSQKNIISNMSHARMVLDNVVIETDSLIYYGNESLLVLNGNVMVMKNDITVKANHITLNLKTGWLDASGSVKMENPNESFQMETFRYNLNQNIGEGGPSIQGVVKGKDKDFYVTGKTAKFDGGTVIISPAGITRCPRKDYADWIFSGKRMIIQGKHVYMEKVVLKIMSIPVFYLPHMALRGESLPHINLSANKGTQPDLNQTITTQKLSAAADTDSGDEAKQPQSSASSTPTPTPAPKREKVRVSPRFSGEINTNDKPSQITVGRIYEWNRYSDEVDVNFDSEGIFSVSDIYQIDWNKYNLTIDGKTDLASDPKRDLGVTFTKKAWETAYGNWQVALFSRLLYDQKPEDTYQGLDGGYRLDYQLTPDFNLSYLYIQDLSGSTQDWEQLETKFLIIDGYRLGGNLIYGMKIPLSPHYFIYNNGTYNFRNDEWVSQITGIAREVDCIRIGFGWDFAKNFVDLTFRLNY
ncbi:MAG TPA: hypothetical protein DDW50_11835 [Firmicutes bacterium]|jgi:hypothetical protein|nr:hypothetical protein [Bacillota bacterium]